MRRYALMTIAALSLAACSNDSTGPSSADLAIDAGAFGTALTVAGGYDAAIYQERLANALPDEIKLSDEQRAKIRALIQAFESATKADREALGAIIQQARRAAAAGKSREEVNAILRTGADIRARLAAAEVRLKAAIDEVLTPEQRAWIASHSPRACRADRFPPLTEAQKAQILALEAAFHQNNKADLETIRAVIEEARAAVQAGKSREEIAAILARGVPAAARLAAARRILHGQIVAVLTPEQKASGCFPLG